MKKRNLILTCCLLMVAFVQMAQENQNEQFLKNKNKTFKSEKGHTYHFRYETNQFGNVVLYRTIEYKDGGKKDEEMFVPDHEAFPVTFIEARYETDGTELEDLKVLDKEIEQQTWQLIFIGDTLYQVWYWYGQDDYELKYIATAKKEKKGKGIKSGLKRFGKAFKEEMTNSGPTKEERKASLQKYLDEAFAKQEELAPAWEKENADYLAKQKENKKKWDEYVEKKNSDYWKSPEGQAVLKRWKEEEGQSNESSSSKESGTSVPITVHVTDKPGDVTVWVKIYYTKPGGSESKSSIADRQTSTISAKEGSTVYYTIGDDMKKKVLTTADKKKRVEI